MEIPSRVVRVLYDIQKGSKLVVALVGTIHTTVDCNEADIVLRKCNLGVHSYFQIVTPDPTHVFGYDDTDLAFVNHGHHALPIWSLKVCAGVPVIYLDYENDTRIYGPRPLKNPIK